MPSGENWQNDVLRDLRGGAAGQQPAAEQGEPAPRPDVPAQNPPPQHAEAQPPGYGYPHQQQPQPPGHGHPPQQPQTPGYGYPQQQPAPGYGYPPQPHPDGQAAQPPPQPHPDGQAAQAPYQPYADGHVAAPAPQQAYPQQPYAEQPPQAAPQPVRHPAAPQPSHQGPSAQSAAARRAAPDTRPVVDKRLASVGLKPRHGEPFSARALRAVRRTVSSSAAREVAETTATAEVLQRAVTTGRQIAVTSIRGGSGKTTIAALLGTAYAHYRQDPVLLVEADPALGSLPLRLGAESLRWTIGDFAALVEPQMSLLDITGYLVQLPENAWLLPGSQGQVGAMLDTKGYERVMVSMRRYFGVTVVDCETLPAEVARTALSAAQARVLAAPATMEGIASTRSVLEWMRGLPRDITTSTVVVLTEQAPHPGLDLDKAAEQLKATGASVRVLPYDRHLAAGGVIRTELLARATRQAVTRLAAEVFELSQKSR
ncbi:hypothetical protein ACIBVL_05225 [Streptomyces sp. NPDC049687]|uniref:AAA family ATPase n=1 Tax=Streptomyces sp. NPDC049687 TaxID=3365596 RepID=UPI0037AAF7C3